ncbi:MAG TPA: DNA methyltransferase, partial [Nitrososphaera sp.]|nr:DNA methyltransferase [Nitrososphaera sp.]
MARDYFQLLHGDARSLIKNLAGLKARAIITSPPYFGHRKYGIDPAEIGREETADSYLDSLAEIFSGCKRVLAEDGSLWIVIGDTRRKGEKLRIPHRLAERLV